MFRFESTFGETEKKSGGGKCWSVNEWRRFMRVVFLRSENALPATPSSRPPPATTFYFLGPLSLSPVAPSELFSKYENFPTLSKVTSQWLSHIWGVYYFNAKRRSSTSRRKIYLWEVFSFSFSTLVHLFFSCFPSYFPLSFFFLSSFRCFFFRKKMRAWVRRVGICGRTSRLMAVANVGRPSLRTTKKREKESETRNKNLTWKQKPKVRLLK